MDEGIRKFLVFVLAVGMVALAGIYIYNKTMDAKTSSDAQADKATNIAVQMNDAEFTKFDGGTVSGTEVIGLINSYNNSEEIGVIVKTKAGAADGVNYLREFTDKTAASISDASFKGYVEKSLSSPAAYNKNFMKAKDKTDIEYINPTGKFAANLIKDSAGSVKGVQFTQK